MGADVAEESGERRDHRVGDDAIGLGPSARHVVEAGAREDDDRRLAIRRPPAVEIEPLVVSQPVPRDAGQQIDAQLHGLALQPPRQSFGLQVGPVAVASSRSHTSSGDGHVHELEPEHVLRARSCARASAFECREHIVDVPDGHADRRVPRSRAGCVERTRGRRHRRSASSGLAHKRHVRHRAHRAPAPPSR